MNNYYIKNDEYTICKVLLGDAESYELWHKQEVIKQSFKTVYDAINFYEGMKK